jgi:hypothetical protein
MWERRRSKALVATADLRCVEAAAAVRRETGVWLSASDMVAAAEKRALVSQFSGVPREKNLLARCPLQQSLSCSRCSRSSRLCRKLRAVSPAFEPMAGWHSKRPPIYARCTTSSSTLKRSVSASTSTAISGVPYSLSPFLTFTKFTMFTAHPPALAFIFGKFLRTEDFEIRV